MVHTNLIKKFIKQQTRILKSLQKQHAQMDTSITRQLARKANKKNAPVQLVHLHTFQDGIDQQLASTVSFLQDLQDYCTTYHSKD